MRRPGKTIQVKPDIHDLLTRHSFTPGGHHGGELYYDRTFFGEARLSVCARYRDRPDDEWENSFRLELALNSPAVLSDIRLLDGELLTEQDLRRRLAFVCDAVIQLARRIGESLLPPPTGEIISGFDGDWTCLCGNKADGDGFYSCDASGVPVSAEPGQWTSRLNLCAYCGRLFHQDSLEVHGTSALRNRRYNLSGRPVYDCVRFFANLKLSKERARVIADLARGEKTKIHDPDTRRKRTLERVR